jgi:hypothetical protein
MTRNISTDAFPTINLSQLDTVHGGDGGFWGFVEDAARYTTGAASAVAAAPLAIGKGVSEFAGAMRQGHSVGDSAASGFTQGLNTTGVLDRDSKGPIPKLSEMPNPMKK